MADETTPPDTSAPDTSAPDSNSAPLDPGNPPAPPPSATGQAPAVLVVSAMQDAAPYTHDETVPGGLFIVGGQTVNAEGLPVNAKGQRLNDKGKVMTPEEVLMERGRLAG